MIKMDSCKIFGPDESLPLKMIKKGESEIQARARLVLSVLQNVYGAADTYRLGFDQSYWVDLYESGQMKTAVALLRDTPIGTHSVFRHTDAWESLRAAVVKLQRGKGIGKALFHECLSFLNSKETEESPMFSYLRASDPCEQSLHLRNNFHVRALIPLFLMREIARPIDRVISEFALFVTRNKKPPSQHNIWLTESIPIQYAQAFLPESLREKLLTGSSSERMDVEGKFFWHKTGIDPDIAVELEADIRHSPSDFANAVKDRFRSHDHFFGIYLPTYPEGYCAFQAKAILHGLYFLGFRWLDGCWHVLFGEVDSRIKEIRKPEFCSQITSNGKILKALHAVAKPLMLGRHVVPADVY
jgi:hypothetical protein